VLQDAATLERIRAEGWRIILDEAQDTDPQQFAVLVEITRPPGAPLGSWPSGGGEGPRAGHFCMVGDGQQSIYSSRADVRNFQRHLAAFEQGNGGEQLTFGVTFRAPHAVIALLNHTLPAAFGPDETGEPSRTASGGCPQARKKTTGANGHTAHSKDRRSTRRFMAPRPPPQSVSSSAGAHTPHTPPSPDPRPRRGT